MNAADRPTPEALIADLLGVPVECVKPTADGGCIIEPPTFDRFAALQTLGALGRTVGDLPTMYADAVAAGDDAHVERLAAASWLFELRAIEAEAGRGTEIRRCTLCGTYFETTVGRGRPRSYCSEECRKWSHALSTLTSYTEKVLEHADDPEKRRAIRSRLWSLANSVNRAGRA
jgi:hypothetical protein